MATDWNCYKESVQENIEDGMDDEQAEDLALYE